MSYVAARRGRVFVVRWLHPTREDVAPLTAEIVEARAAAGEPLVYVCIVDPVSNIPDAETRRYYHDHMDTLLPHCERGFAVVEGDSARTAAIRALMRTVLIFTRFRRVAAICASFDEVLDHLGAEARAPHEELRAAVAELRQRGAAL